MASRSEEKKPCSGEGVPGGVPPTEEMNNRFRGRGCQTDVKKGGGEGGGSVGECLSCGIMKSAPPLIWTLHRQLSPQLDDQHFRHWLRHKPMIPRHVRVGSGVHSLLLQSILYDISCQTSARR